MGFEWWKFHSWMLNAGQSFLIVNECYLRCLAVVDAPPLRLNLDPDLSRISKFRCKIRRSYTKNFRVYLLQYRNFYLIWQQFTSSLQCLPRTVGSLEEISVCSFITLRWRAPITVRVLTRAGIRSSASF